MDILESIMPEEVPETASQVTRAGVWTGLCDRAISDWQVGKVTVVRVKDAAEYKKMRNGTSDYFRKRKFSPHMRTVAEADGLLRVYIQLESRQQLEITHTKPVEEPPPVKRISIGNRSNSQRR